MFHVSQINIIIILNQSLLNTKREKEAKASPPRARRLLWVTTDYPLKLYYEVISA